MPLKPKVKQFIEDTRRSIAENPTKPLLEWSIEEYREAMEPVTAMSLKPTHENAKWIELPGEDGHQIPIRVTYPDNFDETKCYPVLLFFQGGGFCHDFKDYHYELCERIAKQSNCIVFDVIYRLAPEHKYPAQLHDGISVLHHIIKKPRDFSIDTNKIVVSGYSAGGGLAAVLAIKARDENIPLLQQILISPVVDFSDSLTSHRTLEQQEREIIGPDAFNWSVKCCLDDDTDLKDPDFSPYFHQELTGIAPATLIIAEYEFLRSQGEAYTKKLQQANVPVTKIIIEGQIHNYIMTRALLDEGTDPTDMVIQRLKTLLV